jgi:prefoldin beta subunit
MEQKEKKLQEMQMLEQNLQNLFFQKQSFQMELSETVSALKELENSGDQVFKIIGQLMIKKDKKSIKEELENKKKLIELRLKSLEKQEEELTAHAQSLRKQIIKE